MAAFTFARAPCNMPSAGGRHRAFHWHILIVNSPANVEGIVVESQTMGKVVVAARIENAYDLHEESIGSRPATAVRRIDVPDALVDTGASTLSLPQSLVTQLGLKPFRTRPARTSAGPVNLEVFGTVRLTIHGRECNCDAVAIPDDCPMLIGQIPMELLDFVVDPAGQRLIGNPAHGGEHVIELY